MAAIKHPDPEADNPPPAHCAEAGSMVLVHDKVLSDIRHELGNVFHKLYYWSEYLKDKPSDGGTESSATQMLERTIKNLEDFLKVSLDYFHPTHLSLMRMAVPDVVGGLLSVVRNHLNGTPMTVADAGGSDGEAVMVDPSQLSHVLAVAAATLGKQAAPDSRLHVAVLRATRGGERWLDVTFELHHPTDSSPLFRTSRASVEWAVAQKIVQLHGGALCDRPGADGTQTLSIVLPLSS